MKLYCSQILTRLSYLNLNNYINYNFVVFVLLMLSEDFDNIFCYLSTNVYPKHVLDGKNCSHAKKNFRVKSSQFQIGVNGKLFKVISVCFYNILVLIILFPDACITMYKVQLKHL